jgi:hypothetical protein
LHIPASSPIDVTHRFWETLMLKSGFKIAIIATVVVAIAFPISVAAWIALALIGFRQLIVIV